MFFLGALYLQGVLRIQRARRRLAFLRSRWDRRLVG